MDELIRRVMELGKLELQMCELVNFAQKHLKYVESLKPKGEWCCYEI